MDTPQNVETTLYLVRHGETEYNRQHMVQGRGVDAPLNEKGILQAKALAKNLQGKSIDVTYSSTLLRAKQTSEILIQELPHKTLICLRDLEEMSWGIYEGRARSTELDKAFGEMKAEWAKGNYAFKLKEGESLMEVQERGVRALNYIVSKHQGQHILIVSHGRFIRILLSAILDDYNLEGAKDVQQHNTALNHLIYNNDDYQSKTLNCIDHLVGIQ